MSEKKNQSGKKAEKEYSEKRVPLEEGYQPFKKGHQPCEGNLDSSNPPQGESGIPSKASTEHK